MVNGQLLNRIDEYIEDLFVPPDAALEQNLKDAHAAGLPSINVSPNEGRLLYLIAKMARAQRVLEIGTLGGFSTTWLARALPSSGQVVTLELNPTHAAVARKNLDRAGVGNLVDIRVGRAGESLRQMIAAGEPPFDLVFIDADKPGYVGYLDQVLQLAHSGTVILADNLIRNGDVLPDAAPDESAACLKAYNALIATHPRLESILLPILRGNVDGLSISIVK